MSESSRSSAAADRVSHPGGRGRSGLQLVREFPVARERVWLAWTRPDAIVQWLGPPHWPASQVTADVRVGGTWRACLSATDSDRRLWQSGRYLVVEPPERLEFTFQWEGANHEDGPGVETHVTVVLVPTADGGTRMQFSQVGLASAQSITGHIQGWEGTFGRLAQFL